MIPQIFPVWFAFAWFHGRMVMANSIKDDPDSVSVAIGLYWKTAPSGS